MNVPRGFQIVHGRVTHVNPLAAMFNPAWATETSHMVLGAYLATTFGVASVYAVGMLRGRRDSYHRKAIAARAVDGGDPRPAPARRRRPARSHRRPAPAGDAGGDRGRHAHRARRRPERRRVPAARAHNGDVLNVKVPNLLSLLAFDSPNAPVRGLDTFPKADRTPLAWATRLAFIGMVGIGTGLVALSLWYWLRRRRNGTRAGGPTSP